MLDPHDLDVYRHNLVHMHISGYLFSPKLEFGNLGNPQKPCEITLFAARQMYPTVGQHPATADGVRLEYGEELLFGKKLAIELLSKVSPGETVRVRGRGRYRVYSEIRSQYDELADNPNVNYDDRTRVRLTLELSLSEDSRKVVFSITTRKTGTEKLTFEKGRLLRAPRYSYR